MNDKRLILWMPPATAVLVLTLLAFGLRFHRLDFQPLWGDEGWSFYFGSMSLGQMVRLTAEDIHPPLYYVLLGRWLRLAGVLPAAARFMSTLFGTLLVPLAYRVAARLFDPIAGLMTAAVVTLSPFAIYYSQEVRMYGLVTLLGLGSVYFFHRQIADVRWKATDPRQLSQSWKSTRYFWGYILATTAALYTMYYAVFVPIFQLIFFLRYERHRRLRNWLAHPFIRSVAFVFFLYLPWIVIVGTKLVTYVQGKRTAEGYVPLGPLRFVESHLITFSLGHLSDATRLLAWGTLLFLPVALLGLAYGGARARIRRQSWTTPPSILLILYLLGPLLLGYLINLVYPFTPRYFERTLMLAAPGWWLLLGAGLAWLWRRSRPMLIGASTVLFLIQAVMLWDFYTIPRYQDESYRSLLAYVHAHSIPDDVFLASYQWQVGYYYAYLSEPRPTLYIVPSWGETWAADSNRMRTDLDGLLRNYPRLWFPAYQALGRLWESEVETHLNQSGFPVQVDWSLPTTKLLLYAGGDQLTPATTSFNFANRLLLEASEVGGAPAAAGRGVVPVTLVWRKLGHLGSDHRVALRLTDADNRTWASRDSLPQGGEISFTELATGEQLADRHGLAIPAGTPPGDYQLRLSVYDQSDDYPLDLLDAQDQPQGVEAVLATVQVILAAVSPPPEALTVQYQSKFDFGQSVRLLGYSLSDGPFRAGDTLTFSLFWQALSDGDEPYVVFAQLQDDTGQPVALSETPPIYPSDRWSSGLLLRDPHEIRLPATLPAGTYYLAVGLLRSNQSRLPVNNTDQVVLTEIQTTQRPHDFTPPSPQHLLNARFGDFARLLGYDLRGGTSAYPGQSLTLILYWQALETSDRNYAVFAHVVDANDRIFGQRDQVPGNGDFPTTSWVPEEYLTDAYAIPVNPDTSVGDYWIELGLYNPVDGVRLPVTDADDQPLGDRLLLRETPIRVD
jgi:4-amino-4-deoxy-L-arabinose transferase-like glycosyltransferase